MWGWCFHLPVPSTEPNSKSLVRHGEKAVCDRTGARCGCQTSRVRKFRILDGLGRASTDLVHGGMCGQVVTVFAQSHLFHALPRTVAAVSVRPHRITQKGSHVGARRGRRGIRTRDGHGSGCIRNCSLPVDGADARGWHRRREGEREGDQEGGHIAGGKRRAFLIMASDTSPYDPSSLLVKKRIGPRCRTPGHLQKPLTG